MKKLRVWWIPQMPMEAFFVPVSDIKEAKKILSVLAEYDLFQFENKVKPDYSNTGGLEVKEDDGNWCEWENEFWECIDEVDMDGEDLD